MCDGGAARPVASAQRRRSLGALLRLPLGTRSLHYHPVPPSKPGGTVPPDVILEIVDLLTPADILNFSLTVCPLETFMSRFPPSSPVLRIS